MDRLTRMTRLGWASEHALYFKRFVAAVNQNATSDCIPTDRYFILAAKLAYERDISAHDAGMLYALGLMDSDD